MTKRAVEVDTMLKSNAWCQVKVQLHHKNAQQFQGGLVFKAHRLCVSLDARRESNKQERKKDEEFNDEEGRGGRHDVEVHRLISVQTRLKLTDLVPRDPHVNFRIVRCRARGELQSVRV